MGNEDTDNKGKDGKHKQCQQHELKLDNVLEPSKADDCDECQRDEANDSQIPALHHDRLAACHVDNSLCKPNQIHGHCDSICYKT